MITTMTRQSEESPPQDRAQDDMRSAPIGPAIAATAGTREDGFPDDPVEHIIRTPAIRRGRQPMASDQRMHDDPADRGVAIP